jgi:hypothetical protein
MCIYVYVPLLILSGDCWGWELLLTGEGGNWASANIFDYFIIIIIDHTKW